MVGWSRKRGRIAKIRTVIGRNTEIRGDVIFRGGLHLDGAIRGNVSASEDEPSSVINVSEGGFVEGDVRVANVFLNGSVVGDVYAAERVELAARARISGSVYYKLIEMDIGAEVNGSLVHRPDGAEELNTDTPLLASPSSERESQREQPELAATGSSDPKSEKS